MSVLNKLLLGLFLLSAVGTSAELWLLDHFESWWQRAPLIVLGAGIFTTLWVLIRQNQSSVLVHRLLMVLLVVGGITGFYLHYDSNVEFELEMNPALAGIELFQKSIKGAMPALAPFAMSQFGLLGLIATFRWSKKPTS
jgi:hypothetical protein